MKNKYYNDAIIGNENMVVSFSKKGEMLRLICPAPDYKQYIDEAYFGIKVNDSNLIYLHDDVNNVYDQYYTENTNILNTEIKNTYFNISVLQTDFVCISQNLLIKKYKFTNENNIDLDVRFLAYSKLLTNQNNMISSKIQDDICMQYAHDFTYSIFTKEKISGYRLHNGKEDIKTGVLSDKDYIGIGSDVALSYEIGTLKPGESKEIDVFIYINNNNEKYKIEEIIQDINKIKKVNVKKELEKVVEHWNKFVNEHDGLNFLSEPNKWKKKVVDYEKVKRIYVRSILLFALLYNSKTGGISSAIEVDENQTKCGRYSYCWPRDAIFITKALDILKMHKEADKFYLNFAKETQLKNGMWEQRYYTDGRLAPCWGYQIDETASIVYGVYEHYKENKNRKFLEGTYQMCKNACKALMKYIDIVLLEKKATSEYEIFERYKSYDLWEMNEGIHLYSLSAIIAGLNSMIEIEKVINSKNNKFETTKELENSKVPTETKEIKEIKELRKRIEEVQGYIKDNFINNNNTLRRSLNDDLCDISILGTIYPFETMDINSKEIKNTIQKIEWTLRTYTGGYLRFENDNYLQGNYPWPIATLWMALYNLEKGNKFEALHLINFVTETQTQHGLLAEQVDNETMDAKWVIGLGWSHAMYLITLKNVE